MLLQPGHATFTKERLAHTWHNPPYGISKHRYLVSHSQSYRSKLHPSAKAICEELYRLALSPDDHVLAMDEFFEQMYTIDGRGRLRSDEMIINNAYDLLQRLPRTAPDALGAWETDPTRLDKYMNNGNTAEGEAEDPWTRLAVVKYINAVVLRAALFVSIPSATMGTEDNFAAMAGKQLINGVLELLRTAHRIGDSAPAWTILKAFLFTTWSRLYTLFFWKQQSRQLQEAPGQWNKAGYLEFQGLPLIPDVFHHLTDARKKSIQSLPYLCPWSFRLLDTTYAALGLDFRYFFSSYRELHAHFPAGCSDSSQCDGASPANCERFVSHGIVNQSTHDDSCVSQNCPRLFWDTESFKQVDGARALRLDCTNTLLYQPFSARSMAVSHVWSHGQGGRPNIDCPEGTGFNLCLHNRYVRLARRFGCDSYWMDTPCIPDVQPFKDECVKSINKIFTESQVVLVCDRDIMRINISELTSRKCELILTTLLVFDWNVRAWTLLESMRGRSNLQLLCANGETVSALEVIHNVHKAGNLSLSIFSLNSTHLIPFTEDILLDYPKLSREEEVERLFGDSDEPFLPSEKQQIQYLPIGEAAALLSHRHMTRDGDDVMIWGYLAGESKHRDAVGLWRSRVGEQISTGSLISSSPRIEGEPGLSWAPAYPTFRYTHAGPTYIASDGAETMEATVQDNGLRGLWLVQRIAEDSFSRYSKLAGWSKGILLQTTLRGSRRNTPMTYGNAAKGPLIVLCGSNEGQNWFWLDVFEWDAREPLPEFETATILIS